MIYEIHTWLAARVRWVQYPEPRYRSLDGHPTGWRLRWSARPKMNKVLALCLPTMCLFVPYIGLYLAIAAVIFLFAYFRP